MLFAIQVVTIKCCSRVKNIFFCKALCYLFYFLEYSCKFLVYCQASSLNVTSKISPGAQTVLSEEHRERLQSLQHLLKAHKGHIRKNNDSQLSFSDANE